MKDQKFSGTVIRVLGNNNYEVRLEHEGQERLLLCYLSGRMNQHAIKVLPGDTVQVVVPPRSDRGRITFRGKAEA